LFLRARGCVLLYDICHDNKAITFQQQQHKTDSNNLLEYIRQNNNKHCTVFAIINSKTMKSTSR
jgi:hypothetical protein